MYQTTKGLVLREAQYKEADKILTILTTDFGIISAKARGVKRGTSKLKSGCQLLSYSEFTFTESRGFHTITEATPLEMFAPLREDIERLALASYFAQTAEVFAMEDTPNPDLLRLILFALSALCRGRSVTAVKAAYEFRLAAISGYEPELGACPVCGEEYPNRFSVQKGRLLCDKCGASFREGLLLPVDKAAVSAMRYVLTAPTEKVFSFELSPEAEKLLSEVTEAYLLTQLERGFFTLDFYKSLHLT